MSARSAQIEMFLDNLELRGTRESERETYRDALSQALAQFDSISEMVTDLQLARNGGDDDAAEVCERMIHEDALSVEVRDGWRNPSDRPRDSDAAEEFRILLCTGGPAVQITGAIGLHGEPEKPQLEFQGWFIPWTQVPHWLFPDDDWQETLLDYCRCFYFGE